MDFFRVKNFEKFQHYKDRTPPWIKLYNDLLDNYEFGCLQDASKLHLIMIWLLASRNDNKLPLDSKWIGTRINATEIVDLEVLIIAGFIEKIEENQPLQNTEQDASKAIAKPEQDACLEGEGETEEERETDNSSGKADEDKVPRVRLEPFDLDFAEKLWRHVQRIAPKTKPPKLEDWADSVRLMRERDDCAPEEILQVFDWFVSDSFWRDKVQSGSKFRKQFAQMHSKMINGGPSEKSHGHNISPASEALYRKYPHLRPQ